MYEVSQDIRTNVVEVPITATASNSLIVGISQYGDYPAPSVANMPTTIDYQQNDGGGDSGAAALQLDDGDGGQHLLHARREAPSPGQHARVQRVHRRGSGAVTRSA